MYLVHAQLASNNEAALPPDTVPLVTGCARPEDRLEHVAVHQEDPPGPVLGLFLLAESLEQAEGAAFRVCLRALRTCRGLTGFRLLSCGAAWPAAYYEGLLAAPDEPA